jgi:hypothetical protein
MFETRGRHHELNYKINLKSVHFVGLRHIAVGSDATKAEKTAES